MTAGTQFSRGEMTSSLALAGGLIRFKERAAERIAACARDVLGSDVSHDAEPLMVLESIREPRVRGHLVSLLYRCRLHGELDDARRAIADPPSPGEWRWHDHCPPNLVAIQVPYAKFFRRS